MDINFEKTFFWCDLTITLAWIYGPPRRWETLFANRVTKIKKLTKMEFGITYHLQTILQTSYQDESTQLNSRHRNFGGMDHHGYQKIKKTGLSHQIWILKMYLEIGNVLRLKSLSRRTNLAFLNVSLLSPH